jgi:hypothetical protein
VCVCVCMCIYIYVCVCVCVRASYVLRPVSLVFSTLFWCLVLRSLCVLISFVVHVDVSTSVSVHVYVSPYLKSTTRWCLLS